jgi:hypothetical protein
VVITDGETRELAAMRAAGVKSAEFFENGKLSKVEFRDPDPPAPEPPSEPQGSGFSNEVDAALGQLANRGKKTP